YDLINDQSFSKTMSSESQREAFWAKSIPSRLTNVKSWSEHITDKQLSFSLIFIITSSYALEYTLRPWRLFTLIRNVCTKKPLSLLENFLFLRIYGVKGERDRLIFGKAHN